MKKILILSMLFALSFGQRGDYSGRGPVGYPGLASRFKEDNDDSTSSPNVVNRFDQPNQNIPVDARGDADLVNRLNSWPRETRPFWILNAEHIEAHRNTQGQNFNTQGQNFNNPGFTPGFNTGFNQQFNPVPQQQSQQGFNNNNNRFPVHLY